jgi:hypothetical protein
MPQVGVLQLLSMAPPRVGTTYAYRSLFAPVVELNRLHGKPRDKPCTHGIVVVLVGTRLTS